MADKIELEIVTPKGRALEASVDEVTAPGTSGEFGVPPGHLPTVTSIRAGIVTYRQGNEQKKVAVGPGFAEAGQQKLLILAEDFADRANLDPVVLRKELNELHPKLEKVLAILDATPETESEKKHLIAQENWLATQLELYGDPPSPTMRPFEEYGPPQSPLAEEEEGTPDTGLPMGSP